MADTAQYVADRMALMDVMLKYAKGCDNRDLALYREWAAQNIEYNQLARCYRPTSGFVPLFPFQPDRVLSWLSQGFGDGLELKLKTLAPYEGPGQLFRPDLAILSALTRALCAQQALSIDYLSLSSGRKTRDIVPVALADNGLHGGDGSDDIWGDAGDDWLFGGSGPDLAEGGTGDKHSEVVLRSSQLRGPYTPYAGNPILSQRTLDPRRPNPVTSAGHAKFVQTPDGEWWATIPEVFHVD